MQTWLDSLVRARAEAFTAARIPSAMPPDIRKAVETVHRNVAAGNGRVLEAARFHTLFEIMLAARSPQHTAVRAHRMLNALMAPFLFDYAAARDTYNPADQNSIAFEIAGHRHEFVDVTPDALEPVALRLDRDLVADLTGARAPVSEDIEAEIRSHTWYLDLPHRALMLQDMQVRAIFVGGQPEGGGYTAAVAVLTRPGQDYPFSMFVWPFAGADAEPTGPMPEGFDQAEAERQLSDLVCLVVAYRMTRRGEAEQMVPLSRMEALAADRKWRQKSKKTTLFRVADLKAPADRFGRTSPRQAGEASWKLGWRSTVAPHLRWQAHGPQWSSRKLIWIEAHERGPQDAPRKAEIENLR